MNRYSPKLLRRKRRWLALVPGLFAPLCYAVNTQTPELPAGVDLSQWACRYCAFQRGYSGEVEAGVGFVSGDSFKFGEYNGLNDKGFFLIGNASASYRNVEAGYLDFRAHDLGLDSRHIFVDGGRQGQYRLFFDYQEIPHYIADHVKTPYRGSGSDTLVLPGGWTTAGSTAGMTGLSGSLQDAPLQTQRRRLSVGASIHPASHWQTRVEFHHEVRDGQIASAGTFFFNSAQLIVPVDYVTNEAQASVSYVKRSWQVKFGYYGSFFTNHDPSLTWQNAYNPIVAGATTGQLALPPSNLFHQFLFSGGYQLTRRTRMNGNVAIGRMEQDKALLAATTNTALAVSLPETSTNARVDTLTANLRLNSHPNSRLHINGSYRYNDRDNKTPSLLFNWVTTDSFAGIARRNLPYSFTDRNLRLAGDYRFSRQVKIAAGYQLATKDRTHQDVDHTREGKVWGEFRFRARRNFDLSVKAIHAGRVSSGYHSVSDTNPPENILMRKYNMADRSRDSGLIHLGVNSFTWVSVELDAGIARDRYHHAVVGLTSSRDVNYNADVSFYLGADTSLHLYAAREQIVSRQNGSQSFTVADWYAQNDDTIDSLGAGLKRQYMRGKLTVGGDYQLSHSIGRIRVDSGAAGSVFPELKNDLISLRLYADYRLSAAMALHMAYWYENYRVSDWQQDGITSNTIANVVGFGGYLPSYDVRAVMATIRYRF